MMRFHTSGNGLVRMSVWVVTLDCQSVCLLQPRSFLTSAALPTSEVQSKFVCKEKLLAPEAYSLPNFAQDPSKTGSAEAALTALEQPNGQFGLSKPPKGRPLYQLFKIEPEAKLMVPDGPLLDHCGSHSLAGREFMNFKTSRKNVPLQEPISLGGTQPDDPSKKRGPTFHTQQGNSQRSPNPLGGIPMQHLELPGMSLGEGSCTSLFKKSRIGRELPDKERSLLAPQIQEIPLYPQELTHQRRSPELVVNEGISHPMANDSSAFKSAFIAQAKAPFYPSRLLIWKPKVYPRAAHCAEFLAQELQENIPSAFELPGRSHRSQQDKERPNLILLPLAYDLLMKGITNQSWKKIKVFWRDFWKSWVSSRTNGPEVSIPLLIWTCEFIGEATIPNLFSQVHDVKSFGTISKGEGRDGHKHRGAVERMIKFFSVGNDGKFRFNTVDRHRVIAQILSLAEAECSRAEILGQGANGILLNNDLEERLREITMRIKEGGSQLWDEYQMMPSSTRPHWKRGIKAFYFGGFGPNDPGWEKFMKIYVLIDRDTTKFIPSDDDRAASIPFSYTLKDAPEDPDELLRHFRDKEERKERLEGGFEMFLPGRIHNYFELKCIERSQINHRFLVELLQNP